MSAEIKLLPLVTEKSAQMQALGAYAFLVDLETSKEQIKKAVEKLKAEIEVVSVRTLIIRGKVKRVGRSIGKRSNYKKAVVRLAKGQSLELFDTV